MGNSGFFNTGVPGSLVPSIAGFDTGLLNSGSFVTGLFNVQQLLRQLSP